MSSFFFILLGYCSGSILYAYYLPLWCKGIDITADTDDQNPGAFNCFAKAGRGMGILALACDLLKGWLPVLWAAGHMDTGHWSFALMMAAPVLGHAYPLCRRFRGGKAIAVTFGVTLGLMPVWKPFILLAALYLFFSLVVAIQPHRCRSIVTFLSFAFGAALLLPRSAIALGCVLASGLVISRHIGTAAPAEKPEAVWLPLRRG